MFASPTSAVGEPLSYDFQQEENIAKWKGVFVNSLKKVLEQVHPSLEARQDALDYVESLILRMLGMLCGNPPPLKVEDVEKKVRDTFPAHLDKWALKDGRDAVEKGKKKSPLVLPVDKIHQLLQKEVLQHKIDSQVTLFVVGVLEYIAADILKLVGNYVKNIRHVEISCEDIRVAMYVDVALMDMFHQDDAVEGPTWTGCSKVVVSQTYEESVHDLIQDERHYLRDLHMIIKVFREEIAKLTTDRAELDALFSNIMDIYELTVSLFGSLEDVMEMTEEKQTPSVGSCFSELAEAEEFDVYSRYAEDIVCPANREVLKRLLSQPEEANALSSAGHGFKEAVKYYLPKLLMQPVWHFFLYFEYIEVLHKRAPNNEEAQILDEVRCFLNTTKFKISNILESNKVKKDSSLRMQSRARRQAALEKTGELQKTVDGWDQKDIGQCCNEFIREGMLKKVGNNARTKTERRALLFDGLLVLCKPSSGKRVSVSVTAVGSNSSAPSELRLKERFFIRKVNIIDREDEELKNAFEIATRDNTNVILVANSAEDKNSWMADLVMLNTKSMLERTLDSILLDEERKHPLKLPPPHIYKFAEPDSLTNIVVEARENAGVPLIKGATLVKLVERLTYHIYADPAFVRTFLITYRSFCSPQELLKLLIDRFEIPDPSKVYDEDDRPSGSKTIPREDFKRYRKEFCQPVQFRVLNVFRHWADHHFYDFEKDSKLLKDLLDFLNTVKDNCKSMKKWVNSVLKIVARRSEPTEQRTIAFSFERSPPPIEWHLRVPEEEWGILTLHPIEIARQLTLLEFELYRNVKPSELVGSVWTKKDKEKTSPNLLKMIKHTTNFTRWLEKTILEAENIEERVAIVSRAVEIMIVLQDLNNFNGVLAIVSAMNSAAIYRLYLTFPKLSTPLRNALADAKDLSEDHFRKYQEKLRSINPPCVPFFGMYLTNILHIEEGNHDFLQDEKVINYNLINFSKRRKVAEIIGEIQQYQNQPYCLSVEPRIRRFLENLCPFEPDMTDASISNYLYDKSMEIEPRGATGRQIPKVPRKWPDLSLKSPGIKARSLSGKLPAPLQAVASSVRLYDPPSQELPFVPSDLPETPPHHHAGSSFSSTTSDHSVFAPVFIGVSKKKKKKQKEHEQRKRAQSSEYPTGVNVSSPGSPGAALSLSSLSLGSPGSSPQLGSPGHMPSHLHQSSSISHFGFNSGTIGTLASLTSSSSLTGSPGASSGMSMMPPPGSPSHLPSFGQSPPPLPPRINRRREGGLPVDSPHQARQAPNAPMLPPREGMSPPPLPPRRDVPSSLPPRFPPSLNTSSSALLARRNSTLESGGPTNSGQSRRHMSFNGPSPTKLAPTQPPNGQITPRLPPKPHMPGKSPGTMFNFTNPPGSS